jgi:hypothetical protein
MMQPARWRAIGGCSHEQFSGTLKAGKYSQSSIFLSRSGQWIIEGELEITDESGIVEDDSKHSVFWPRRH